MFFSLATRSLTRSTHIFLVKIQTDGTITPTAALEQACIGTLSSLEAKFKRELSFRDVEGVTGPAWTSGRAPQDCWFGICIRLDL
jgi:hypothetical protein